MNLLKTITTNTTCLFQFPTCHSTNSLFSSSSLQYPKHKLPSFHLKLPSSSKTPIQGPTRETFDFQDDDEFEDEDEDIFVPLSKMRQWTRNKPKGFGEGKVYDTSLEDKLLQELDQSRAAQIANINNLKNNPNPISKLPKPKEAEEVPNGIRVRLFNLPKKKNIHRDLQAAFKPFTGISNIVPAVSGNQKTRDPLCKGFAFVHFNSHKEANRFVDIISTQPITFGKVQKQIRCEIMKPDSPVKASVDRTESPLPVLNATMAPVTETSIDPCVEDAAFDMLKMGDDDLVSATDDYDDDSFGKVYNLFSENRGIFKQI